MIARTRRSALRQGAATIGCMLQLVERTRRTGPRLPSTAIYLLSLLILFTALPKSGLAAAQAAPIVAAASDLKFPLEEIALQFRATNRHELKLVFGSSGNFYQQIGHGAPFELFMSADEAFVQKLAAAGRTEDEGQLYAIGRLVLFAPHASPLAVDGQLAGLKAAAAAGRIARFAIANPQHAPYGRAAEQALKKAGAWEAVRAHLVFGENVSQAAQFASGGSATGGIFAYSLALSPEIAKRGRYVLIAESLHRPLRQRMVLLAGAGDVARTFYRYLQEPPARAVLARYGFVLPERR